MIKVNQDRNKVSGRYLSNNHRVIPLYGNNSMVITHLNKTKMSFAK